MKPVVSAPEVLDVVLDRIVPRYTRETNPNKMSDEQFAGLVELINLEGFLQPITVEKAKGDKLLIVDGHHRFWAMQKLGRKHMLVVISAPKTSGVLGLGMNRLRGATDLGLAGEILRAAIVDEGMLASDVSILSGFTEAELGDLITIQTGDDDDDVLTAGLGDDDEEIDAPAPKPFILEITFVSKGDLQRARKLLKKAGKGDLAAGVLNLLGVEGE